MSLFGRNTPETENNESDEALSHRFTLELSRAEGLAKMVANSRASPVVEIADLLAGMYIYEWEKLSKYWSYTDQERIEDLLRRMCRISPERWNYWIQFYDKQKHTGEERLSSLPFLRKLRKEPNTKTPLRRSAGLVALLKQAAEIAPFHDTSGGRNLPILTSECVLLCIVRDGRLEVSRKLTASGMNISQLERDAMSSRRAPRG